MVDVVFEKVAETAVLPRPATVMSAGQDAYASITGKNLKAFTPLNEMFVLEPTRDPDGRMCVTLDPMHRIMIPLGFKATLPAGYEFEARPRSGLALKNGITLANSPGTIDADFNEEYAAILINMSNEPFTIVDGMRVAQLLLKRYEVPNWVSGAVGQTTDRNGGYGSTGL